MRPNQAKRLLLAGRPAVGIFISSASALAAELAGNLGFDWVLVDLQHGENNLGNLSPMLQAISATPATPFVRVPANDAMLIQRALDLGAYGIIVPMVNSPPEAEAAVRAARYAPRGTRSWGPIRGSLYGGADYFQQAAEETMLFAMLETAQAVAQAQAQAQQILATSGIDGCYIGPNDLGITLGVPPEGHAGETLAAPLEEAIETVLAACRATGKIAGMQLYSASAVNRRLRQGFRFVAVGTELRLLSRAAIELLHAVER